MPHRLTCIFGLFCVVALGGCDNVADMKLQAELRAAPLDSDDDLHHAAFSLATGNEALAAAARVGASERVVENLEEAMAEVEEMVGIDRTQGAEAIVKALEDTGRFDKDGGFSRDKTMLAVRSNSVRTHSDSVWDELERGTIGGYKL